MPSVLLLGNVLLLRPPLYLLNPSIFVSMAISGVEVTFTSYLFYCTHFLFSVSTLVPI